MTLMRCYVTNASRVLPSPCSPMQCGLPGVGKGRSENVWVFARRTSCLKHPLRHHFQHFPSIATNPEVWKQWLLLPCSPAPRILTRLVWRGRLVWRRLPFLKAPLWLCLWGFCPVWGLRTTALCTSLWFKSTCFLLVSDPLPLYVSILLTTVSLNISSAELRASQAARLFKNLVLTSSMEDQMH